MRLYLQCMRQLFNRVTWICCLWAMPDTRSWLAALSCDLGLTGMACSHLSHLGAESVSKSSMAWGPRQRTHHFLWGPLEVVDGAIEANLVLDLRTADFPWISVCEPNVGQLLLQALVQSLWGET